MIVRYILLVVAVFSVTSCDDFLEPDSLSTFDSEYIFSNPEDARKGVNAIYVHFSHDGFRSRLSNNMTGNTDIEHNSGWSSDGARYQIWDLNAQENNGDLDYVWTIGYQAIRDANIAIEGIESSAAYTGDDEVVAEKMGHLLGEAYTLRAYWFSMLTFYFGDVPFPTSAPKAGVEFNLAKTDRNVILSHVIHDMIKVEDKMMWADEAPFGIEQVNREYTLGMIARLSLQRGGWFLKPDMTEDRADDYLAYYDTARMYSKKLIELKDRPLPGDYRQEFLNQSLFIHPVNDDVLFEVPFAIGEGDVAWNIGVTVASGPYGTGNNYMNIPPTYYYSFDPADKRRDVTCALYKYPNETASKDDLEPQELVDINNIAQGKWSRTFLENAPGSNTSKGTGINWPMLRYADVLLMYAEVENELDGPTADAQDMLARVRERAFPEEEWGEKVDDYINTVSASKESFFDAIVNERAWEFGGEMIRKYELIRWNLYADKVQETVEGLKEMADEAEAGISELPEYLYVRNDPDGTLVIYDTDSDAIPPDIENWEQQTWLLGLVDESQPDHYDEWITRDWARYTAPVRYIFPIPIIGIENSQGVLQNDGYGF